MFLARCGVELHEKKPQGKQNESFALSIAERQSRANAHKQAIN
jgi:hypothetical protein